MLGEGVGPVCRLDQRRKCKSSRLTRSWLHAFCFQWLTKYFTRLGLQISEVHSCGEIGQFLMTLVHKSTFCLTNGKLVRKRHIHKFKFQTDFITNNPHSLVNLKLKLRANLDFEKASGPRIQSAVIQKVENLF